MIKSILAVILCFPAFGAVTSTSIWRVWSTGSNNNGGCFDSANQGATGIDYSQQTGAQFTVTTDLTTSGAGATTITQTGGTWTNAVLGNCIKISAGSNFTAGYYVVTGFTDSNNIVLNASPSPSAAGSAGTGVIGGANSTIAQVASNVVAGNTVYIKATATYTITSSLNLATSGSSGNPISWIGYATTDTDGGPAVLQTSGGSINLIGGSGNFQRFINLTLDCNSQTTSRASSFGGSNAIWQNNTIKNCSTKGLLITGASNIIKGNIFTANAGSSLDVNSIGHVVRSNVFHTNTSSAVADSSTTSTGLNVYVDNVFANNTGASTDGLSKTGGSGMLAMGNLFYANGRDGLRISGAAAADSIGIRNNIFYGNTGTGLNNVTTDWSAHTYNVDVNYNAFGGNGTALSKLPAGANDVTLSADPTTNGASNNFVLNSTAGGGAALKGAGFPGALPVGGTGYRDIGPLQHQDTGGASAAQRSYGVVR